MTRLESSAWTLAGGSLCVFALAVLLNHVPWRYTFVVLAVVVAAWSLRAPLVAGIALGGIAWAFLTGFDLNPCGHLVITGLGGAVRAGLLVAAAPAGAMTGRLWAAGRADEHSADGVPPAPEQIPLAGVQESLGVSDGRYGHSVEVPQRRPHARDAYGPDRDKRAVSVSGDPTEETRDV